MFANATSFNQDLSSWNISAVSNMDAMFANATSFNQDLSNWDVSGTYYFTSMFDYTDLSDSNKCSIHTGFSSNENWEYDWDEYCSD